MKIRRRKLARRALAMAIVVALQALAAFFFIADLASDVMSDGWRGHLLIEGLASLALLAGVILGALQAQALVAAARADELAVAAAKGALADLMTVRFREWGLSEAEADVALFALKGCDIARIAELRSVAQGTIRAQLTRVYAKAGVNSQSALTALFIDDLLDPAPKSAGI